MSNVVSADLPRLFINIMKWIQRMLLKDLFMKKSYPLIFTSGEGLKYGFKREQCEFGADEWKSNVNLNEQISPSF